MMQTKQMSSFHKHSAGKGSGAAEQKMQQSSTPQSEIRRRIEPILDASGTLKRHAMSMLDEATIARTVEVVHDDGSDREDR